MKSMKQTGKSRAALWRRLALAALGVILGAGICLANAGGLTGDQMPMPFGTGVAVVMSGSMSPALEVDDLVIVREQAHYEVSDIVVYQSGSRLIVHRIIAEEGDQVITQGDANNVSDPPIERSAIKGKVVAHVPGVGRGVRALKTPVGILIVLLAAFAVAELSFRRERKNNKKEQDAIKAEIQRLKGEQEGKD